MDIFSEFCMLFEINKLKKMNMRVLFPILLIALVGGYWACNRNTKATPETKSPELTEKERMKKEYENSVASGGFVKADPKPQMALNPKDSAELYIIDDYVTHVETERGKKYERTDLRQRRSHRSYR